ARQLSMPAPRLREPAAEEPDSSRPPFRFLHETEFESLAPFLKREHPQTIAVVISHLPPDRSGEMLAQLPPALQTDVIRRLVDLDETDPRVLAEVERGLESWLSEQVRHRRRRAAGLAAVPAILEAQPTNARRQLMTKLT